jgi:hypothetical protein
VLIFRRGVLRLNAESLQEGVRYYFCVRAGPTTYQDQHGQQEIVEHDLMACSDGVTVDTQPPRYSAAVCHSFGSLRSSFRAGTVLVSKQFGSGALVNSFMTSMDHVHIHWLGFQDLESMQINVKAA